ncbi:ABC transporter ATP-binding protein [Deltaproteobacteria bacterium OttesenSCG-928-K17]|nr:ABC transporter ATP-binding protein [Deltaproteobacteria bacterium OttesenSCG-928-K17]
MTSPVVIENLTHHYGKKTIYQNLSLSLEAGKVYGLLGKNGVGKTTLIKIMMGFLKPFSGRCQILGDPANHLSPQTRSRVGLLFERHLAYDFFTIEQIEHFYAGFYPAWRPALFWNMVDRLGLPKNHRIANMSEGQRSQVVLGMTVAQDPELLILDDYSMGLDAGYRRLFIDYLSDHLKDGRHTVILTSHVIQDMENFVDEIIFLERGGHTLRTSMDDFVKTFNLYRLPKNGEGHAGPSRNADIKNVEEHPHHWDIFSFADQDMVTETLLGQGCKVENLARVPMSLEDAFVGYTGRY